MRTTGSSYRNTFGRRIFAVAVFILVFACPALLHAQFDAGAIVGRITDASGAPVRDAVVSVRSVDKGTVQTKKASDQGDYEFTDLQIGLYVVSIEAPGFETAATEPVNVVVDSRPRVDVKMKVGAVSETLTVSASASQLETDTSDRGMIIEQTEIQNLPLNGREYADLATLSPGVNVSSLQDGTITERRGSFNVNGNRSTVNNYLLDGLDNNSYQPANQGFNNQAVTESVDAVAQYKVQTGNYSAEYGRSGGGIFNVTTNSGTNQIHGRIWDYFRNTVLDAMGPFYGPAGVKPTLIQNQFGAAIGGPIRRDSIFFFADYEGLRQITTSYQTATLPTVDQRAGKFVDRDGDFIGLKNPYTGVAHLDGQIPDGDITPFARAVLAALPLPNIPEPQLSNNYISLPRNQNFRDIGDVRLDFHPTSRMQNFLRYTQQSDHIIEGPHIPGPAGGDGNGHTRILATQVASGVTFTVSSNSVLDARFAATFNESGKVPLNQGQPSINGMFSPLPSTLPYLSVSLNEQDLRNMSYFGEQSTDPQYSDPITLNPKINYTFIHGKHSISVGYEYLSLAEEEDSAASKMGTDNYAGNFSENYKPSQPQQSFACTNPNAPPDCDAAARPEAYGVADFMYGARSSYQLSNYDPKTVHNSFHYAYVQDAWRASSRLTLSLGLRYEFQVPQWTDGNQQANFDPNTNTLVQARNGSIFSRTLVNAQKDNFAPRFGFAFTSDPKTVWRGAYGISYIQFNRSSSDGNISLNGPATIVSDVTNPTNSAGTLPGTLCPAGAPSPNCFSPTMQGYPLSIISPAFYSTSTSTIRYMPKDSPTAYVQSYFFGMQTQLAKSFILDIAYVGSHGVKLRVLGDYNQAPEQTTSAGTATVNARRPVPGFQAIIDNLSAGFLRYNSLQVKMQMRTKQIFFVNSFTWARAIDNAAADTEANYGDGSFVNIANIKGDSGTSAYNQPLNDTLAAIWNLPFGKKRGHGLYNTLVGNWQLDTITRLTSGVPINLTYDPNAATETTNVSYEYRPNVNIPYYKIMNPHKSWQKTNTAINGVFSPSLVGTASDSAITIPAPNVTYGNISRNIIRGTPYYNVDLGVHKQFPFGPKQKIEFRAEGFNVLNHTNWKAPDSDISSSTYGQLTAGDAYRSRIIQFALKILF